MIKLILVRHGEAIETGTDPGLSAKGKLQAEMVAKRLAQLRITKVYVSNAQRTLETYEKYKALKPDVPAVVSEKFKEIYRVIVGGPERVGTSPERREKDKERAEEVIKEILSDAGAEEIILLFSHGNFIRYIIANFLKIDKANINLWDYLEIHEASMSLIDIMDEKSEIRLINSIEHLDKREIDEFYNNYTKTRYNS